MMLANIDERPIGTSSSHNFIFVRKENNRTSAMRLGFAKGPLSFEDLIWPGERVPRPKRDRRRGKKAIAA